MRLPVRFFGVSFLQEKRWAAVARTYIDNVDNFTDVFGLAATVAGNVDVAFWNQHVPFWHRDSLRNILTGVKRRVQVEGSEVIPSQGDHQTQESARGLSSSWVSAFSRW